MNNRASSNLAVCLDPHAFLYWKWLYRGQILSGSFGSYCFISLSGAEISLPPLSSHPGKAGIPISLSLQISK